MKDSDIANALNSLPNIPDLLKSIIKLKLKYNEYSVYQYILEHIFNVRSYFDLRDQNSGNFHGLFLIYLLKNYEHIKNDIRYLRGFTLTGNAPVLISRGKIIPSDMRGYSMYQPIDDFRSSFIRQQLFTLYELVDLDSIKENTSEHRE